MTDMPDKTIEEQVQELIAEVRQLRKDVMRLKADRAASVLAGKPVRTNAIGSDNPYDLSARRGLR